MFLNVLNSEDDYSSGFYKTIVANLRAGFIELKHQLINN